MAGLRAVRDARELDEVECGHDAVLVTAFLSGWYLTLDGRVLTVSFFGEDVGVPVEASPVQRRRVVAIARRRFELPGLDVLWPVRGDGASDCVVCDGSGWQVGGTDVGSGEPGEMPCRGCHGLGWTD